MFFDIFLKRSEKHENLKIRQPSHTLGLFLGFPGPSGRHFSTPVGVIFRILFGSRFGCVLGAIFDGFLVDFGGQVGAKLGSKIDQKSIGKKHRKTDAQQDGAKRPQEG